jgi:hypothetical protein
MKEMIYIQIPKFIIPIVNLFKSKKDKVNMIGFKIGTMSNKKYGDSYEVETDKAFRIAHARKYEAELIKNMLQYCDCFSPEISIHNRNYYIGFGGPDKDFVMYTKTKEKDAFDRKVAEAKKKEEEAETKEKTPSS